jgi:hypothetical protein
MSVGERYCAIPTLRYSILSDLVYAAAFRWLRLISSR